MSGREGPQPPPVVVRLLGGLGNQLFQYAYGRELAYRRGAELVLDASGCGGYRDYGLGRYSIRAAVRTRGPFVPPEHLGRLGRWVRRVWPPARPPMPVYEHLGPGFDPSALEVPAGTVAVGFWQSEKYFPTVAPWLPAELTPTTPPAGPNRECASRVSDGESVAVHVRRGDYLLPIHRVFGVVPPAYYTEAVERVRERVPEPRFFVFSDDPGWCRANLPLPGATFVTGNGGPRAFEDLRLMSLCRHQVIANSSFSWWAAWLNRNPGKLVIAPRPWFADPASNSDDRVPAGWVQLPVEYS